MDRSLFPVDEDTVQEMAIGAVAWLFLLDLCRQGLCEEQCLTHSLSFIAEELLKRPELMGVAFKLDTGTGSAQCFPVFTLLLLCCIASIEEWTEAHNARLSLAMPFVALYMDYRITRLLADSLTLNDPWDSFLPFVFVGHAGENVHRAPGVATIYKAAHTSHNVLRRVHWTCRATK